MIALQEKLSEIPLAKLSDLYIKGKEIGKGSYGTVYLGHNIDSFKKVAIKEIKSIVNFVDTKDYKKALDMINLIETEVHVLKELAENGCNVNIVCYDDFFLDLTDNYLYLVTQY